MRSPVRTRLLYLLLVPLVTVAAGIVGYYLWTRAAQFARLGEETIAESTLLIVREKVDIIEQYVIQADNHVFGLARVNDPDAISRWLPTAAEVTPSVRAFLMLDENGLVASYVYRGGTAGKRKFYKIFMERVVPDLQLERQRAGRLTHLHRSYAGKNYLISYRVRRYKGRRYYLVAQHDTSYIVREQFPSLFATDEAKRQYNIVDENNHRVYGPNLATAGDYLFGLRFPTTLYGWRLQVAPKQAPLLEAQASSRRTAEVVLIGTSFGIILLGVVFLIYAANEERRLNMLKSEFIANVSHELKTPLSAVRMFGELLLTNRVASEKKRRDYLEIICRETDRLTNLIENVLDFSALERGEQRFDMRRGDLQEVAVRAVETVRYRTEQKVQITWELEGDVEPVWFDEQAVLLAMMNLLDNAVKYGDGTPIHLLLRRTERHVEILVRDRGPGIPTEARKRVFDRFYRTGNHPEVRGSGIGLALVRQIAEAHRGRAWVEDAHGGGTIVAFSIPLAPPRKSESAGKSSTQPISSARHERRATNDSSG